MLDLLIPGQSPGIKERLVDLYGKPEILFFGPDGASAIGFSFRCVRREADGCSAGRGHGGYDGLGGA